MLIKAIIVIISLILVTVLSAMRSAPSPSSDPYRWQAVAWGGGGYVTGFVFHPTVPGLVYARTDIGGAYRRDPGSLVWHQMLQEITRDDHELNGILSVAVDQHDPDAVYLAAGMYTRSSCFRTAAILRSHDRGRTWQKVELPIRLGGNEDGRGQGERLQVDPNLGSILFLGTSHDGLYRSGDGGLTWAPVRTFPSLATTFVHFDRGTGTLGHPTPHLYVGVVITSGPSLYHSQDGGQTWAPVPNQDATLGLLPMSAAQSEDVDGIFLAYSNGLGPSSVTDGAVFLYRDVTQTWTCVTPPVTQPCGFAGLGVRGRVVAVSTLDRWSVGDAVFRSVDAGRTWTCLNPISTHAATDTDGWIHGWTKSVMGWWITDLEIDPFDPDHVLYNTGFGLAETHHFLDHVHCDWYFNVDGLEETDVTSLVAPPSGAALFVTVKDVGGGRYATTSAPVQRFARDALTTHGLAYAYRNPNLMARTVDAAAMAYLSSDNGRTWAPVTSRPVDLVTDTGRIAVSSTGASMVWVPGRHAAFHFDVHSQQWHPSSGYPVSDAVYSGRFYVPVADCLDDRRFYTFDFTTGRLLQSDDAGRTFGVVFEGAFAPMPDWTLCQLVSVPTEVRDLWLATPSGLYHIDGMQCQRPVKIDNVQAAYAIGFGARAGPHQSYPTLFVAAKIGQVVGLYRSVTGGSSWTRIDDDHHLFYTNLITGDPHVFGRVYIAPSGRGVLVGMPDAIDTD